MNSLPYRNMEKHSPSLPYPICYPFPNNDIDPTQSRKEKKEKEKEKEKEKDKRQTHNKLFGFNDRNFNDDGQSRSCCHYRQKSLSHDENYNMSMTSNSRPQTAQTHTPPVRSAPVGFPQNRFLCGGSSTRMCTTERLYFHNSEKLNQSMATKTSNNVMVEPWCNRRHSFSAPLARC